MLKDIIDHVWSLLVLSANRGYGDTDHPMDKDGYVIDNLVKDIVELVGAFTQCVQICVCVCTYVLGLKQYINISTYCNTQFCNMEQ